MYLASIAPLAIGGGPTAPQPLPADGATDQIVVRYRTHPALERPNAASRRAVETVMTRHGYMSRRMRQEGDVEVWRTDRRMDGQAARTLAAQISAADPNVLFAEPDLIVQAAYTPNDLRFTISDQWNLMSSSYGGINASNAWDLSRGAGMVIAVLDTGIRFHPDLVDNIIPGYDFISDPTNANDGNGRDADYQDPGDGFVTGECGTAVGRQSSWHGTHVAGIAAASTNNRIGIAGVSHHSFIQPVRVLGKCGGYTSDIADGILWASGAPVPGVPLNQRPANIINLSLSGFGTCPAILSSAIETARNRGSIVVAAAGNSGDLADRYLPGNCVGSQTVGSVTRGGLQSAFSNYGGRVSVWAPGENIFSTVNGGSYAPVDDFSQPRYQAYSGTSMATPQVAGVAALVWSRNRYLSARDVESIVTSRSRIVNGLRLLDAGAAVSSQSTNMPTISIEGPPPGGVWYWDSGPVVTVRVTGANPQGSVTFYASGQPKFSVPLSGGIATVQASRFAVGNNGNQASVSALYMGDANNNVVRSDQVEVDILGD